MFAALALATCLALPSAPGAADEAAFAAVPAEALWAAHVDLQQALSSTLLEAILREEGIELHGLPWDEVRARLDLDPLRDLLSVTAYGMGERPEDAVALLATTPAMEVALQRLGALLRSGSQEVDGLRLQSWSEPDGGGQTVYSYMARRGATDERMLLVSPDGERLARGVQLLRGEGACLDPASVGACRPGTILRVVVPHGLAQLADLRRDAPEVVDLLESLRLEVGEHEGRVFVDLYAVTEHAEAARQVTQVVQGALALAAIVGESEPDLKPVLPLLRGLRVQAGDRSLELHLEQDAGAILQLIREARGEVASAPRAHSEAVEAFRSEPAMAQDEGWR